MSKKIQISKLSEKYERVLRYCEKEVDKIMKMFKRQREDPPLPRNYSPLAGKHAVCSLARYLLIALKPIGTHWLDNIGNKMAN